MFVGTDGMFRQYLIIGGRDYHDVCDYVRRPPSVRIH